MKHLHRFAILFFVLALVISAVLWIPVVVFAGLVLVALRRGVA